MIRGDHHECRSECEQSENDEGYSDDVEGNVVVAADEGSHPFTDPGENSFGAGSLIDGEDAPYHEDGTDDGVDDDPEHDHGSLHALTIEYFATVPHPGSRHRL